MKYAKLNRLPLEEQVKIYYRFLKLINKQSYTKRAMYDLGKYLPYINKPQILLSYNVMPSKIYPIWRRLLKVNFYISSNKIVSYDPLFNFVKQDMGEINNLRWYNLPR